MTTNGSVTSTTALSPDSVGKPVMSSGRVRQILLRGSSLPHLKLQGKGEALPDLTPFAFRLPVIAQLYAGDGTCWAAEFGAAESRRNDPGYFSGKTPAR